MKKFTISDIHGCRNTFEALLKKIKFSKDDELYLLGDYIDRGPDSKGVIDLIWQLQNEGHFIRCLKGNHEEMYLDEGAESDYHKETLESFSVVNISDTPKKYMEWMAGLPHYFEVDNYLLVHAGFNFFTDDPLRDTTSMLWERDWYDAIDKNFLQGRIIIHGHTPKVQNNIEVLAQNLEHFQVLGIDNGCVYNEPGFSNLVAFEMMERKLFFQPRLYT